MKLFKTLDSGLANEFPRDICFYPCCSAAWRDFSGPLGGSARQFHFADRAFRRSPKAVSGLSERSTFHGGDAVDALRSLEKISIFSMSEIAAGKEAASSAGGVPNYFRSS